MGPRLFDENSQYSRAIEVLCRVLGIGHNSNPDSLAAEWFGGLDPTISF